MKPTQSPADFSFLVIAVRITPGSLGAQTKFRTAAGPLSACRSVLMMFECLMQGTSRSLAEGGLRFRRVRYFLSGSSCLPQRAMRRRSGPSKLD